MSGPTTLLTLTRHGETEWHSENRYAGSSDVALTDRGRHQADRLGAWAARSRPDAVACSGMSRARATATPAAAAVGVALEIVEDLREMHFGDAEGRTLDEIDHERPGAAAAFRSDPVGAAFPGAEDPRSVASRVASALRSLAAAHPGRHVLVVAHNTALRLALCVLLGLDARHYRDLFPRLDNVALTRLRLGAGPVPALLALNVPLDPRTDPLEEIS